MRYQLTAILTLTLLASACSSVTNTGAESPDDIAIETSDDKGKAAKRAKGKAGPGVESAMAEHKPLASRNVGDFFVHRFSGSFTKQPITLSEEVTARAGSLIVVDYTFDQGKSSRKLRVTHDADSERVLRVLEVVKDKEIAAKIEDFEAMMAKTSFSPDSNTKTLVSEKTTCVVGGDELDCEKVSYEVAIGNKSATLSVTQSTAVPGRDISGEIVDAEGNVIYRAELIDMGRGSKGVAQNFTPTDL